MNYFIKPGDAILYMKVGAHAREGLEDIIARKTKEIEDEGYALWGYGGNTCHPETMVQPFAKAYVKKGQTVRLLMHPMNSSHFAEQIRADEFSIDGLKWKSIPKGINVLGSRFALKIRSLHETDFDLPLHQTVVAIGNSTGRSGHKYISGRVDKACLEVLDEAPILNEEKNPNAKIGLVAELMDPYAVYLRNKA